MRIARIDLEGFGCLRDFHCEVANGIHIFFGPNESGKSTLQQAIFALLYGFYEGGRARRHETAQHDRYRPWDAGAYAGRLEFEVETGEDKGKRYRVQRDFSSRDVPTTVWDQTTGEDVTNNYPAAQHGAVAFARTYLGMPKSVFDACAFVSQGELFDLANDPGELNDLGDDPAYESVRADMREMMFESLRRRKFRTTVTDEVLEQTARNVFDPPERRRIYIGVW